MARPLSPHLQIYKPQLTSVLSILHRFTGVVLSLGALVIAVWLVAAARGGSAFRVVDGVLDSIPGRVLLFLWSLALFYHLCNGVRHLLWDAGVGFDLTTTYRSGVAVVVMSLVLTLGLWAAA